MKKYSAQDIQSQFVISTRLDRANVPDFSIFPFSLPFIKNMEVISMHRKVTIFVGENGCGKSTFLEAIAVAMGFNAEGGGKNFQFNTRRSHSNLYKYLRIAKGYKRPETDFFFRAESFFNLATEIEHLDDGPGGPPIINSYGRKSLHEQSHGESFLSLLNQRFSKNGLYILDEPEAALSPSNQLIMLSRIKDLVENGSQFIIATHSPIIMAYPESFLYECTQIGITRSIYQDTQHYKTFAEFFSDSEKAISKILK